ncbi:glycoside hydrolase family 16 protein [Mycena floridula]|nr:glycoside hydrolase family 16 protein [Mycena floridula]
MVVFNGLPLYLTLLLLDLQLVSAENVLSGAFKAAHGTASRHTKRLARDLRIAFGGILVSNSILASQQDVLAPQRVVYCKSGAGSLGAATSGSDGGNTSSPQGSPGSSAGLTGGSKTATGSSSSPTSPTSSVNSPWTIVAKHAGNTFFDDWTFWTDPDPTHGTVDYIDESDARSAGLLEVNSDGNAIMRVETTPTVANNRKSIRITTKDSYNGGLFILDAVHMPTGCAVWPAFWSNGPNWPIGGEIDIVEGVNDYTNNQATIHTNPGCVLQTSDPSALNITGTIVGGTNCAAAESQNQGCGARSPSSVSFGAPFNNNGGGVYAMKWDTSGIAVFFFPRGSVPADITAENPLPGGWGKPMARYPAAGCDPFKFFFDNVVIFDTTLCGDWAGGVWSDSGIPGQEQSCAARTGFSTCEAFVAASGASFKEAYWEVSSVKIYHKDE